MWGGHTVDAESSMRLLDLFCGAGGSAVGYHRAGFDEIVGIDIKPQPHYPFTFILGDALHPPVRLGDFDLIHASPPCQSYSSLKGLTGWLRPALIEAVRAMLVDHRYVIENVVGAPLINPVQLCGSSFGLGVRRHRLFESSEPALVLACSHSSVPLPLDVTGTGGPSKKPRTAPGGGLNRKPANIKQAQAAMGIDWMTRRELSEAIPPAYTEYLGAQFLDQLAERR